MKLCKVVYKLDLKNLPVCFADYFANHECTAMPLESINDVIVEHTHNGGTPTKQIPNPNANKMLRDFKTKKTTDFSEIVVEYKNLAEQTILYLFPDASIFRVQDTILTGEARRDLIREVYARKRAMGEFAKSHEK